MRKIEIDKKLLVQVLHYMKKKNIPEDSFKVTESFFGKTIITTDEQHYQQVEESIRYVTERMDKINRSTDEPVYKPELDKGQETKTV